MKKNYWAFPNGKTRTEVVNIGIGIEKAPKEINLKDSEHTKYLYHTYQREKVKTAKHIATPEAKIQRYHNDILSKAEYFKKARSKLESRYSNKINKKKNTTECVIERNKLFWETLKEFKKEEPHDVYSLKRKPKASYSTRVFPKPPEPNKITLLINPALLPRIVEHWGASEKQML